MKLKTIVATVLLAGIASAIFAQTPSPSALPSASAATWATVVQVGGQSITINYRGEVDGNRMTGSAELGSFGTATFTAEKKP